MTMDRHPSETALAALTFFSAALHFGLETWYHMVWGQALTSLLVDYISNALMLFGAWASLRARPSGSAAGLLAAAWGFTFCLAWMAGFLRLDASRAGLDAANGEAGFVMPILLASVGLVAAIFGWALWLAWRQARSR
jgi:hypothetical protein